MTTTREALESVVARLAEIINQLPDETVVPERIDAWPEDDRPLQGDFWDDRHGTTWAWRDREGWRVWDTTRRFWKDAWTGPHGFLPFTRTTDPSQPRRFDSLDDVPDDVKRVTAWYGCFEYELERWPRAEAGWLRRCLNDNGEPGSWGESDSFFYDKLDNIEEGIDHE